MKYILTGFSSWGGRCGEKPGVYTNMGNFGEWVEERVNENGGFPPQGTR